MGVLNLIWMCPIAAITSLLYMFSSEHVSRYCHFSFFLLPETIKQKNHLFLYWTERGDDFFAIILGRWWYEMTQHSAGHSGLDSFHQSYNQSHKLGRVQILSLNLTRATMCSLRGQGWHLPACSSSWMSPSFGISSVTKANAIWIVFIFCLFLSLNITQEQRISNPVSVWEQECQNVIRDISHTFRKWSQWISINVSSQKRQHSKRTNYSPKTSRHLFLREDSLTVCGEGMSAALLSTTVKT